MNNDQNTVVDAAVLQQLDALCDQFEVAWSAGKIPRLEKFLQQVEAPRRELLLRDLLLLELALRRQSGEAFHEKEYADRFPEHAEVVRHLFERFSRGEPASTLNLVRSANAEFDTVTHPPGSSRTPQASQNSFGDYEILDELGKGGMGVVYKARQRSANRVVALKLILAERLSGLIPRQREEALSRFRNEVRAAAKLQHDHVVTVFDVGEVDGQPYYAMRFVDGCGLNELLSEGPLPCDTAARYTQQIAEALAEAHSQGILHRDLKPHNVMVDKKTDRALLADFGLAKLSDSDQSVTVMDSKAVFGSPPYMSPEQARHSGKVDAATDIYGLGATLYHVLTGRPPFQGASLKETFRLVEEREPIAPRELNPAIDRDLETICLKCLEKESSKRYVSAQALSEELGRYQRGEPILARPISRAEHAWRWCKRNPVVAGLSVAVLLVLLAGAGVSTLFAVRASSNAQALNVNNKELNRAIEGLSLKSQQLVEANSELSTSLAEEVRLKERLQWREYAASLASARLALRHVDGPDRAKPYLNQCRWNLRDWEHDYLWTIASRGRGVAHWEQPSDTDLVHFSANGAKRFVCKSGQVTVHDTNTNEVQSSFDADQSYPQLATNFDGSLLATFRNETITVWDVAAGKQLQSLGGDRGSAAVALSPNGERVASGKKVWDVQSGKEVLQLKGNGFQFERQAYTPDGTRIVAGEGFSGRIFIWDSKTGEVIHELKGHKYGVSALVCTNEQVISGGGDHGVRFWELASGEELRALKGHTSRVIAIALSPNHKRIFSGSNDGTMKIWATQSGQLLDSLHHWIQVKSVVVSPDGRQVFVADDERLFVLEAKQRQESVTFNGHWEGVTAVDVHPGGERFVSASRDQTLSVWNVNTTEEVLYLKGHQDVVTCVTYSPDGKLIVSGSRDRTLRIWNASTGEELKLLRGHDKPVNCVAISPKGSRIISGSDDNTLRVWETATGTELSKLVAHEAPVTCVAFHPDGSRIATGSLDRTISIWDSEALDKLTSLKRINGTVTSLAFDHRGKLLASGCDDVTIKLWDAFNGKELATLKGHFLAVTDVCFSPNGEHLYSSGVDKRAVLWDLNARKELQTFALHSEAVTCLDITPDGKRLVTGSMDRMLRTWDISHSNF